MPNAAEVNDAIDEYYAVVHGDAESPRPLHLGYFDEDHRTKAAAVENMTRTVADAAGIDAGDRVLFCGCGTGEPLFRTVADRGVDAVGVDINEDQLATARAHASAAGGPDSVEFRRDDLTELRTVDDGEFDVVWALESVCYAEDEREFLEAARRALRDGGRLVVADRFLARRELPVWDRFLLRGTLRSLRMPRLAHVDDFHDDLEACGFEDVVARTVPDRVRPHTERNYRPSLLGYPVVRALSLVGRRGRPVVEGAAAGVYDHLALRRGIWTYGIVTATATASPE